MGGVTQHATHEPTGFTTGWPSSPYRVSEVTAEHDDGGAPDARVDDEECVTTVLMGAGASADAGVPLGARLADELAKELQGEDRRALRAWEYLQRSCGANFEEVYRRAREIAGLDSLGLLPWWSRAARHAQGARLLAGHDWDAAEMEDPGCLTRLAAGLLGKDLSNVDLSYLDPLMDVLQRQGWLTVSTLNYDFVLDAWGDQHGCLQDDDPGSWRPGMVWPAPTSGRLHVLKLHGSADWAWARRGPLGHRALDLPVVERPRRHSVGDDPAIVFGGGNKLRPGGPFLALLEAFSGALERANHLVIVGYSFLDVHVNVRIANWFDADPTNRSITVLSPSWSAGVSEQTTAFTNLLETRLRGPVGGLQVLDQVMSAPSGAMSLRVVEKSTIDGLKEALTCPDGPRPPLPQATLTVRAPGRR